MKELILVINEDRFFLSHRTKIAVNAAIHGWSVTLVTKDTGSRAKIEEMGFRYVELPINPTGMNPLDEIKTFLFLYRLYKKSPDAIIHHVGLKNMLWGGLASIFTKTRGVVYAVSGLGTLFGERSSRVLSFLIRSIFKLVFKKDNIVVIFQNHDDMGMFVDNHLVCEKKTTYIKGSGVDLVEYGFSAIPKAGPVVIIFTGRLLREKGIVDFVEAAELMRKEYEGRAEFWICGGLSDNPSAMSEDEILSLVDHKYIKWLGHREDIAELLKQSSIMCYPSYYREGVPKSLIEASAIGRPIVTTDSVGCRDTVIDGVNGFLIDPHDPRGLAKALRILIENPGLMDMMGSNSRKIAERDYDVDSVADKHLSIYEELLK